jgi:hypothetical protein
MGERVAVDVGARAVRWQDQTTFADDAEATAGDCLAACVASLLGLPLSDVPNFALSDDGGLGWFLELRRFLARLGYGCWVWFGAAGHVGVGSEGTLAIAIGPSRRGDFPHAVVVRLEEAGLRVIHDPNPSRLGLAGPATELLLLHRLDPALTLVEDQEDGAT